MERVKDLEMQISCESNMSPSLTADWSSFDFFSTQKLTDVNPVDTASDRPRSTGAADGENSTSVDTNAIGLFIGETKFGTGHFGGLHVPLEVTHPESSQGRVRTMLCLVRCQQFSYRELKDTFNAKLNPDHRTTSTVASDLT
jgi:hypothetical protein